MIDVQNERLVLLINVSEVVPSQPARSTVRRWASEGIDGILLETVRLGGRRYTSLEAITRFFERLNTSPIPRKDAFQASAQRVGVEPIGMTQDGVTD